MSWSRRAAPLETMVRCGQSDHLVRWSGGELVLDAHPDIDAELALVAFGGDEPECIARYRLWREAVADGGFLGEWADGSFDAARRWWLSMALERMRNEGFHEFLRDLPMPRARRMGTFLDMFEDQWLDRAACEVADTWPEVTCERAGRLLDQAVARRLRQAFVVALASGSMPLGAAALVPLRATVTDRAVPGVDGHVIGREGRVTLTVHRRWLCDVWGAGLAVLDGSLVLEADHRTQRCLVVEWDGGRPRAVERVLPPR